MRAQHRVSVSGGKDSLATMLLAIERAENRDMDLRFQNADLGQAESQITHDYIGYLEQTLGITIERVRADFSAEFAVRRETIEREWSKEKRRKRHTKECKARRDHASDPDLDRTHEGRAIRRERMAEYRRLCDCPIQISPPVPPEIIAQAKELLVPTGEPFLDLCMLKGRFPSRTAQFCTERLKLEPINAIVHPMLADGHHVVSWLGERADESPKRAAKPMIQRIRWHEGGGQLILYRPIHKWSAVDTFAIAKRHGLKNNALYSMGFSRVGCLPCINCEKGEIAQIDKRFPEIIARLAAWEMIVAMVSRRGDSTFFPAPMVPGDPDDFLRASIYRAVEWSKTSRGGKQFDLHQHLMRIQAEQDGLMCESAYGLCE